MQEEQKETAAGSPVASFQTRRDKPIEVMSLQEKFIELRRQIPRIEKGQHSEEVPYKFAKIDDVWRTITPAMNELGVNFDIIQEENAQIKTMNTQHQCRQRGRHRRGPDSCNRMERRSGQS